VQIPAFRSASNYALWQLRELAAEEPCRRAASDGGAAALLVRLLAHAELAEGAAAALRRLVNTPERGAAVCEAGATSRGFACPRTPDPDRSHPNGTALSSAASSSTAHHCLPAGHTGALHLYGRGGRCSCAGRSVAPLLCGAFYLPLVTPLLQPTSLRRVTSLVRQSAYACMQALCIEQHAISRPFEGREARKAALAETQGSCKHAVPRYTLRSPLPSVSVCCLLHAQVLRIPPVTRTFARRPAGAAPVARPAGGRRRGGAGAAAGGARAARARAGRASARVPGAQQRRRARARVWRAVRARGGRARRGRAARGARAAVPRRSAPV